jgi:hypothetical protein
LARINQILATYERVALEKQEGQIAKAVNFRPWSQGINYGDDICSLISAAVILTMTFGVAMLMVYEFVLVELTI